MPCNCHQTAPLPCCITNLTIGTAAPNIDYLITFKTPDGRTDVTPVTTGSDGLVVLTNGEYRTGTRYRVWISPDGEDSTHQQPFAIGDIEVSCISLLFYYCDAEPQNQTVTLV